MNHHPAYEIRVKGRLDANWSDWLSGLTVSFSQGITTLSGPLVDQAALRGVLCRLWDLNLTLISVHRLEADGDKEEEDD